MDAIVKWPGGKGQELKYIVEGLPPTFRNYFDPFVGGGSVYLSIEAENFYINDKSEELISLYRAIGNQDPIFYDAVQEIIRNWTAISILIKNNREYWIQLYKNYSNKIISEDVLFDLVHTFFNDDTVTLKLIQPTNFNQNANRFIEEIERNFIHKITRTASLEKSKGQLIDEDILNNIETAFKGAYYMHLRHLYNSVDLYQIGNPLRIALFLFIRNYAYSGMFRYSNKGNFNVPYGGIGYNKKSLSKKINYFKSMPILERLNRTVVTSFDFEHFLETAPIGREDFLFLDPPYDTEFSEYAKNSFGQSDHIRLANYLMNRCPSYWMLVIKKTDFINGLYTREGVNISSFEKKYKVSFMNRNDKNAEHLVIKNY